MEDRLNQYERQRSVDQEGTLQHSPDHTFREDDPSIGASTNDALRTTAMAGMEGYSHPDGTMAETDLSLLLQI